MVSGGTTRMERVNSKREVISMLERYPMRAPARSKLVSDLQGLIKKYPEWTLQKKQYVYPDGNEIRLMCVTGHLPISTANYKTAKGQKPCQKVPIQIFLPHGFPKKAPILIVEPWANSTLVRRRYFIPGSTTLDDTKVNWREGDNLGTWLSSKIALLFSAEPPLYVSLHASRSLPTALPEPLIPRTTSSSSAGSGSDRLPEGSRGSRDSLSRVNDLGSMDIADCVSQQQPDLAAASASVPARSIPAELLAGQSFTASSPVIASANSRTFKSSSNSSLEAPRRSVSYGSSAAQKKSIEMDAATLKRQTVAAVGSMVFESFQKFQTSAEHEEVQLITEKFSLIEIEKSLSQNVSERARVAHERKDTIEKLRARSESLDVELRNIRRKQGDVGSVDLDAGGPLKLLYPSLISQIVDSRSEDFANQDVLSILDDACEHGVLNIDEYTRAIGDVARRQFFARATVRKAKFHARQVDCAAQTGQMA